MVSPACSIWLPNKRVCTFQRWFGRQLWSTPSTVASRSKKGRSTWVSITPRFCLSKSRTRRSAWNERPASPASSAANTPYLVWPRLPLILTAAVMSPAPSPSSAGPPTRRVYSSWLKSEGVVYSNRPWFSVKNGRLSLMKVSVAPKLTTRSSLSTWPKSGLIVAVIWNWPFGFQKMSAPPSKSLPPCTLSYSPETYGVTVSSDWLYCATSTAAKSDRKRGRSKLAAGQAVRSPVEPITRSRLILIVRLPPCALRMGAMYQGTRISADQPSASSLTACFQLPSQSLLKLFSLLITASAMPLVEDTVKL